MTIADAPAVRETAASSRPGFLRRVVRSVFQSAHAEHRRSLAKAVSWRLLGSMDTFIIATLISGHAKTGAAIASVEMATKIGLYYLHERGWAHIRWGLKK
jgi:uncharacterized membrane protein